jgi:chromosome segregation ATPase
MEGIEEMAAALRSEFMEQFAALQSQVAIASAAATAATEQVSQLQSALETAKTQPVEQDEKAKTERAEATASTEKSQENIKQTGPGKIEELTAEIQVMAHDVADALAALDNIDATKVNGCEDLGDI